MPCYHPLKGYICQDGKFRSHERGDSRSVTVSCGQCVGCRLERSRQWAVRCFHEASLYTHNCFITLTFDDAHLPANRSLDYIYFQDFMKRLREAHKGCDLVSHPFFGDVNKKTGKPFPEFYNPIRFYMCGEYGEARGRPHFHACIFNFDFPDKRLWRKTDQSHMVYRSKILEDLWPYGFSEIGDVTFHSAAYVARYIMKKVTGRDAASAYEFVDPSSGEVFDRTPEFTKMSLKPGIGEGWLRKFLGDVYPNDYVVINGRKCRPPRYYDKKYFDLTSVPVDVPNYLDDGTFLGYLTENESFEVDELKSKREEYFLEHLEDCTPERLSVKETIAEARVSKLKRSLT